MFCKNCGKQINIISKFCKECGGEVKISKILILKTKFFDWIRNNRKVLFVIFGIILFFIIVGVLEDSSGSSTIQTKPSGAAYDQNLITSSVVNIFCPSIISDDEASGGSGTIITKDGIILTNSHIVPQDETDLHVDEDGCLVVLPDPLTGQPKDIYWANPMVIPGISDNYDLAFMEIHSAYYDKEKEQYAGIFPREFPNFDDTTRCTNDDLKLGEPVRIFGYPAISGGYSLTITDGIISSFPGDGTIVTSAKISHGSSGGLAIDKNGCMIGVPSMVSFDEVESLGVIVSMESINKFVDEVSIFIDNSN